MLGCFQGLCMGCRGFIQSTGAADEKQPGIRIFLPVTVKSIHQPVMSFFRRKTADADKFGIIGNKNLSQCFERNSRKSLFLKSDRFRTAIQYISVIMAVVDDRYSGRICSDSVYSRIQHILTYGHDMVIALISITEQIEILISSCTDLIHHIAVDPNGVWAWCLLYK